MAGTAGGVPHAPGRLLATEEIVFLAARKAALGRQPTLLELNQIGWVLTPDGLCGSRSALRAAVESAGAPLHIAAEVHDVGLQLSLAERGLGVALLPRQRAMALRRPQLRRIAPPGLRLAMQVSLVQAPHLGALQQAVDWLAQRLAGQDRQP